MIFKNPVISYNEHSIGKKFEALELEYTYIPIMNVIKSLMQLWLCSRLPILYVIILGIVVLQCL